MKKTVGIITIHTGYIRTTDRVEVSTRAQANRKSKEENRDTLFFSSAYNIYTRYLVEKRLPEVPATLLGYVMMDYRTDDGHLIIQNPVVIFDDGRVFVLGKIYQILFCERCDV